MIFPRSICRWSDVDLSDLSIDATLRVALSDTASEVLARVANISSGRVSLTSFASGSVVATYESIFDSGDETSVGVSSSKALTFQLLMQNATARALLFTAANGWSSTVGSRTLAAPLFLSSTLDNPLQSSSNDKVVPKWYKQTFWQVCVGVLIGVFLLIALVVWLVVRSMKRRKALSAAIGADLENGKPAPANAGRPTAAKNQVAPLPSAEIQRLALERALYQADARLSPVLGQSPLSRPFTQSFMVAESKQAAREKYHEESEAAEQAVVTHPGISGQQPQPLAQQQQQQYAPSQGTPPPSLAASHQVSGSPAPLTAAALKNWPPPLYSGKGGNGPPEGGPTPPRMPPPLPPGSLPPPRPAGPVGAASGAKFVLPPIPQGPLPPPVPRT